MREGDGSSPIEDRGPIPRQGGGDARVDARRQFELGDAVTHNASGGGARPLSQSEGARAGGEEYHPDVVISLESRLVRINHSLETSRVPIENY